MELEAYIPTMTIYLPDSEDDDNSFPFRNCYHGLKCAGHIFKDCDSLCLFQVEKYICNANKTSAAIALIVDSR